MRKHILYGLTYPLGIESQKAASIRYGDFEKVEVGCEAGRDPDQRAYRATRKGELSRDAKGLPVQQILQLACHLREIQIAHLTKRNAVILIQHERYALFNRSRIGPFADKTEL